MDTFDRHMKNNDIQKQAEIGHANQGLAYKPKDGQHN